jgi:hypothetical protein
LQIAFLPGIEAGTFLRYAMAYFWLVCRDHMNRIHIGTSGWVYKEWANDFYQGVKPKEQFRYYASQFQTVEINATFYRLPNLPMVHGWREKAPPGFIFAV